MNNNSTTVKPELATTITTNTVPSDNRLRRNFKLWNIICLILNLITCVGALIGLTLENSFQDYSGVIIIISSAFSGLVAAPIALHYLVRLKVVNSLTPTTNLLTICNVALAVILSNINFLLSLIICIIVNANSKPTNTRLQNNNNPAVVDSKIRKQTFNKTILFVAISMLADIIVTSIGIKIINQITPETRGAASMAIGLGFMPMTIACTSIVLVFVIVNFLNLSSLRKTYGIKPTASHIILSWVLVALALIPLIILTIAMICLN